MSSIPPVGEVSIELNYHSKKLPSAMACFNKVFLPVLYETEEEFYCAFKTALEFGAGFGHV